MILGAIGLAVVVAALVLVVWGGVVVTRPAPKRDLESEHDEEQRKHLAGEHPTVVERHLATHPELIDQCPHLPAHRDLITAPIGPMESAEVVAYLCRLCGQQTYVPGPYDPRS